MNEDNRILRTDNGDLEGQARGYRMIMNDNLCDNEFVNYND